MGPNAGSTSVVLPGGVTTYNPIGLPESNGPQLILSPNPTSTHVTLQGTEWQGIWQLIDLMGRIWNTGKHLSKDGDLTLEVGHIPSGYYRIVLENEGQIQSYPLYVVHM